jgi:hypothetical protein
MRDLNIKPADILQLPAPTEEIPFQRHIETKSEDGNYLSITNCNRARFAKLAPHGLLEGSWYQTWWNWEGNISTQLGEPKLYMRFLVAHST